MIISDIEIDGFGSWSGLKLSEFSDRLTVVYGPNEAGKTTLLQCIRSLLYGFSDERRSRYLPPVNGGRPGGRIGIASQGGRYRVERHLDDRRDGSVLDVLTLTTADGQLRSDDLLGTLLGGVDESTFNNVFAVGLDEMQALRSLDGTAATRLLYDLTTGLDRVSLGEVMRELAAARGRIVSKPGEPCELARLRGERTRLVTDLEQLGGLTRDYGRMHAERMQLVAAIERLERERGDHERALKLVETALRLRDRWLERQEVVRRLETLSNVEAVPPEAVQKLDELGQAFENARKQYHALANEKKTLEEKSKEMGLNPGLWKNAPRIMALADQADWLTSLDRQVTENDKELAELTAQADGERKVFSLMGDDKKVTRTLKPLPSKAIAELRDTYKRVQEARRRQEAAEEEIRAHRESASEASKVAASALADLSETDLVTAVEKQGGLVTLLRRRLQVEQRLDSLAHQEGDLDGASAELIADQLLPVSTLMALGGLFIGGVVMFLAGCFLPRSVVGDSGWLLLLLGIAAGIAAAVMKTKLEHDAARRLEESERQLGTAREQLQRLRSERSELDAQLPQGGGPISQRLQTAERRLAQLEAAMPLEARRKSIEQGQGTVADRLRAAKQEVEELHNHWEEILGEHGWPGDTHPRQIFQSERTNRRIRLLDKQIERKRQEREQSVRARQGIWDRINQLVADSGLEIAETHPLERLKRLRQESASQEKRSAEREQMLEDLHKLGPRRLALKDRLRQLERARRRLLRQHKAKDEATLRWSAAEYEERTQLILRNEQLTRDLLATMPRGTTEEDLRHALEGEHEAPPEVRRDQLVGRIAACDAELKGRYEKRGQLNHALETLAADRRSSHKQLELAVVDEKIRKLSDRWQVLAATGQAMESVRRKYESDRQPETLLEAAGYLRQLTDGHYSRIWTPLAEDLLFVDDQKGQPLSVDVLSRGVREQLFLSLRLALASAFARRGSPMPLVLDDVFVNFDDDRMKAAVELLIRFAENGRQVFVFTCHQHVARLFKARDIPVIHLGRGLWQDGEEPPRRAPKLVELPPIRVEVPRPLPFPVARPEPVARPLRPAPLPRPPRPRVVAPIDPVVRPLIPAPTALLDAVLPSRIVRAEPPVVEAPPEPEPLPLAVVAPPPPPPAPPVPPPAIVAPPAPWLAAVEPAWIPPAMELPEPVVLEEFSPVIELPPMAQPLVAPAQPLVAQAPAPAPLIVPDADLDELFVITPRDRLPEQLVVPQPRRRTVTRSFQWLPFENQSAEEFAGEFTERPARPETLVVDPEEGVPYAGAVRVETSVTRVWGEDRYEPRTAVGRLRVDAGHPELDQDDFQGASAVGAGTLGSGLAGVGATWRPVWDREPRGEAIHPVVALRGLAPEERSVVRGEVGDAYPAQRGGEMHGYFAPRMAQDAEVESEPPRTRLFGLHPRSSGASELGTGARNDGLIPDDEPDQAHFQRFERRYEVDRETESTTRDRPRHDLRGEHGRDEYGRDENGHVHDEREASSTDVGYLTEPDSYPAESNGAGFLTHFEGGRSSDRDDFDRRAAHFDARRQSHEHDERGYVSREYEDARDYDAFARDAHDESSETELAEYGEQDLAEYGDLTEYGGGGAIEENGHRDRDGFAERREMNGADDVPGDSVFGDNIYGEDPAEMDPSRTEDSASDARSGQRSGRRGWGRRLKRRATNNGEAREGDANRARSGDDREPELHRNGADPDRESPPTSGDDALTHGENGGENGEGRTRRRRRRYSSDAPRSPRRRSRRRKDQNGDRPS